MKYLNYPASFTYLLAILFALSLENSEAGCLRTKLKELFSRKPKCSETKATHRSKRKPVAKRFCIPRCNSKSNSDATSKPQSAPPKSTKIRKSKPNSPSPPCLSEYEAEIAQFRVDYLKTFLQFEQAPIKTKESQERLRYFAPDPSYRFTAYFDPSPADKAQDIVTSTGQETPFTKYGRVTFERERQVYVLTIYKREGFEFFFIPFCDRSNGDSTYGGGRYLDFKMTYIQEGRVELDFNKAYNPWCHYEDKYACPMPPRSNWLDFPVLAGEKKYAHLVTKS